MLEHSMLEQVPGQETCPSGMPRSLATPGRPGPLACYLPWTFNIGSFIFQVL